MDLVGHSELRQGPADADDGDWAWSIAGTVQKCEDWNGVQGELAGANSNWQLAISQNHGAHVKDFRELKVWEKAHQFALLAYRLTETFPKHELFGMTSQIRRCGSSIPANIAEGCGRLGNSELHRFLQIACGSASELEYHLSAHRQLLEMKRMLVALTRKVGSERKPR
jgi:four helix bundle protein